MSSAESTVQGGGQGQSASSPTEPLAPSFKIPPKPLSSHPLPMTPPLQLVHCESGLVLYTSFRPKQGQQCISHFNPRSVQQVSARSTLLDRHTHMQASQPSQNENHQSPQSATSASCYHSRHPIPPVHTQYPIVVRPAAKYFWHCPRGSPSCS